MNSGKESNGVSETWIERAWANPIDCLFQKFTHCSAAIQGYLREVNRIYQASVQPLAVFCAQFSRTSWVRVQSTLCCSS